MKANFGQFLQNYTQKPKCFRGKLAGQNSVRKKTIKWPTKLDIKRKGMQRGKRERETKTKKNSQAQNSIMLLTDMICL